MGLVNPVLAFQSGVSGRAIDQAKVMVKATGKLCQSQLNMFAFLIKRNV